MVKLHQTHRWDTTVRGDRLRVMAARVTDRLLVLAGMRVPAGASRLGLLVVDVDAAHRPAVDAGATEMYAPVDTPWQPQWSCVVDSNRNRIDLYQG
jgi:hypothetical protein